MIKNRKCKKLTKAVAFTMALLTASLTSFAVYGTVVYDSSKDPVVAYSAMKQYVSAQLETILTRLTSIEQRLETVELFGGGGSGSGSGSGVSSAALTSLMDRISALEASQKALETSNKSLQTDLKNTKAELKSLVDELQAQYDKLADEVSDLGDDITSLQNSISSIKKDISTLNTNFKQISSISTKLETVTLKVNNLTAKNGDIATLKSSVSALQKQYDELLDEVGTLYEVVFVPYGSTVFANDDEDTVMIVLRTGSAAAVSPYRDAGTAQGLNDLSDGAELYDGAFIPMFHNILIPRGGTDGRGVVVTSIDGAYFMIGGDYRIVGS